MIDVFDASALLALVRKEPGWDIVRDLLAETDSSALAHAMNICEVFYDVVRSRGEPAAHAVIQQLVADSLVVAHDMDDAFWQEAGRLKAVHRRISLADCCGLALARRLGAELVTADHHEFDALVPLGLCAIRFIR